MSYAIIKDNKVINRIVADPEFITAYCLEIGASFSTHPTAVVGAERIGDEWVVRSPAPQEVTRFQALAALHLTEYGGGTLLEATQGYMDSEADPVTVLAYQNAQVFRRDSPTILALASHFELTDEQVDDLFRMAATIDA